MNVAYVMHELCHRPQRTGINILGIAVGVALFVAINAIASGYMSAISEPFRNLGADLVIQRPEKNGLPQGERSMRGVRLPFSNQPIPEEERNRLGQLEQVSAASQGLLLWEFIPNGFRTIMGVDLSHADLGPVRFAEWVSQGRSLQKSGEVLLEKHFAKFIHAVVGDRLRIGDKEFSVVGLLEIREGVQVSASNMYVSLEDAQSLLPAVTGAVNVMYLRLRDPAMQDSVRQVVNSQLPALSINSSDSFLELAGGMSAISGWFTWVVSAIALLGAALLVIKSMTATLVERIPEIGILKALGWTQGDIQGQLFGEAMVQCVMGGILGILLGYMAAYLVGTMAIPLEMSWDMNPLPSSAKGESVAHAMHLPISISLSLLLATMCFTLVLGTFSSWIMGRSTARVRPAAVLNSL